MTVALGPPEDSPRKTEEMSLELWQTPSGTLAAARKVMSAHYYIVSGLYLHALR